MMQFGMFAPAPTMTVGSKDMARAIAGALEPLPDGAVDPAYTVARDTLLAADAAGFDIILYAERQLGTDLLAWVLASAIAAQAQRLKP